MPTHLLCCAVHKTAAEHAACSAGGSDFTTYTSHAGMLTAKRQVDKICCCRCHQLKPVVRCAQISDQSLAQMSPLTPRSPLTPGLASAAGVKQTEVGSSSRDGSHRKIAKSVKQYWQISWQQIVICAGMMAAVGLMLWFYSATAMFESAFRLVHMTESSVTHLTHMQQPAHNVGNANAKDNSSVGSTTTRPPPAMLFDDTAKLAIEAQQHRDKKLRAEKEAAKGKGLNLEWQRYHHLDGSVFKRSSVQRRLQRLRS